MKLGKNGRVSRALMLALAPTLVLGGLACQGDAAIEPAVDGWGKRAEGHCRSRTKSKATQGSAVVVTDDGRYAVATNRTAGKVTIFSLALGSTVPATRLAEIDVGKDSQPWAAVIGADDRTAYVVLRKTQRLVRIADIGGKPTLDRLSAPTGSEPTGIARSPSGKQLFVANWAEGTVTTVDAKSLKIEDSVDLNGALARSGYLGDGVEARPALAHPRALVVTNDGDCEDSDETVFVTEFFSQARTDTLPADDSQFDVGRQGVVYSFGLGKDTSVRLTTLAPTADTGFVDSKGGTTGCFPHQLYAAAFDNGRVYVTGICSSPKGPIGPDVAPVAPGAADSNFKTQVHATVYVVDTYLGEELPDQRVLLPRAFTQLFVDKGVPDTDARRMPLIPNDIAFLEGTHEAFVSGYGSDAVFRIAYHEDGSLKEVGSPGQGFFNLLNPGAGVPPGRLPIGVTPARAGGEAFGLVLNTFTRNLSVLALEAGSVIAAVPATDLPSAPQEIAANRGQLFFVTGTGRWSLKGQSWNSCETCHPDGLSDNVTWFFGRGPRNTTSMDATYDPSNPDRRRLLNWTGIQDEVHDFELNTRDNSGGVGAIVKALSMPPVNTDRIVFAGMVLDTPTPQNLLNGSVVSMMPGGATQPNTLLEDWNEIDAHFRTGIRSPRGPVSLAREDVEAGRKLFKESNCAGCHGTGHFTLSNVFYTPGEVNNNPMTGLLRSVTYTLPPEFPAALNPPATESGFATLRLSAAAAGAANDQINCVLRDVGTFPAMGNTGVAPAGVVVKEVRGTNMVDLAQGASGFNIPSLLNMVVGAPYFHAGNARTLEESLGDVFAAHRAALATSFAPDQRQLRQLVAFLLSIDEDTSPVKTRLAEAFDLCAQIPPGAIQ